MDPWIVILMALTALTLASLTSSGKATPTIRISPSGPIRTLAAALDEARKLPSNHPHRIVISAGDYFLSQPVHLTAVDSYLTIEAATDEKVTLYGGQPITGWTKNGDHLWSAKLPAADGVAWDFRMLSVNDQFCKRARLPKTGTFTHLSEFNVMWMSSTDGGWQRNPTHEELTTLRYRPEDLGPWLDTKNAELTVYHMWDETVVGVAKMDEATHTITFSNPAGHPAGAFGVKKYILWNVREGLTEPGQWYLDRTANKVVYWPLPGEDMQRARAIAPTMESVISLEDAKSVTLRGFGIASTNTPLKAGGFGAGAFAGAVQAVNCPDLHIDGLSVCRVNGQGIATLNCLDVCIENCEVAETGACGIKTNQMGSTYAITMSTILASPTPAPSLSRRTGQTG